MLSVFSVFLQMALVQVHVFKQDKVQQFAALWYGDHGTFPFIEVLLLRFSNLMNMLNCAVYSLELIISGFFF